MESFKLENGLRVFSEQIDSAKTFTFSVFVNAGSYNEYTDNFGIAHFLEHMVFKGTTKRNSRQVMEDIETVGGYINAETSFQHTRYFATVPADSWEIAADVITDIVFNSTLPDKEVDLERKVIQEELKMYSDDSSSHVTDMLLEEMHKSYPNRQTIGGTVQTVAKITKQDLVDFKSKFYQPNNVFIVVSGKVDNNAILEFLKEATPQTNSEDSQTQETQDTFEPDILSSDTISLTRNIEQSHFSWGLFGPSASGDDNAAMEVAVTILGGSSCSRLYQIIREEQGLAYTVNVSYLTLKDTGIIYGYTGLEESAIEPVKEIVVSEFEKLRNELVDDIELKRAISYIKGSSLIQLEKPSSINSYIGSSIIYGISTDPEDFIKSIEQVTAQDIQRVARKYFTPDNWQFSKITPK